MLCYPRYCRNEVVKCSEIKSSVKNSGINLSGFKFYSKGTDSIVLVNESIGLALKVRRIDSKIECVREGLCLLYIESKARVKVAPKVFMFSKNYVLMEFLKGDKLGDFLRKMYLEERIYEMKEIVIKCIEKASILDEIRVLHKELSRPFKHVIVDAGKNVYFIDFGRSRVGASKACNVCSILSGILYNRSICGERLSRILGVRLSSEELRSILRMYKDGAIDANYIVSRLFS